jgi:hypothetical protein
MAEYRLALSYSVYKLLDKENDIRASVKRVKPV